MKNILAIDIGNTNIAFGLFKGKGLAAKSKVPTHAYYSYKSCINKVLRAGKVGVDRVDGVILSSVVPLALARLIVAVHKAVKCGAHIIGRDIRVPIKNLYKNKNEVGQDRLVNAFAAKALYGAPGVVIDLGTAITFDIISKKGEYLGGLILPGIEMSLRSLYDKTALLPRVDFKAAPAIIGRDTVNSMRGGILFGYSAMCDGLVSKYRQILGPKTKVIVTGGNAKLIKRYAKSIQIVDEDLTLKGLALLANQQ